MHAGILRQRWERLLVVDVEGRRIGVAIDATTATTATTTTTGRSVASVTPTASTTSALRTFKACINLEEDFLLLLSTGLRSVLGLLGRLI